MNKLEITKQLLFEIKQAKLNAELKAQENLRTARNKNPKFAKTEANYRNLQISLAKFPENSEQSKSIRFELANLKIDMEKELKKTGLNLKDIKPQIKCNKCLDAGYIGTKQCVCLTKSVHKKLLELAGLEHLKNNTFDNSNEQILKENEQLSKLYSYTKEFATKFPAVKKPNIVYIGQVGIGKTFLLECLANQLLKQNVFVIYTTAFNFSNIMLKALTKPIAEQHDIISTFIECDVLIIDDLGSEIKQKELSISTLFNILNERKRNNKSTIFSSNLMPEQIDAIYGNRICSRIFDKRNTEIFLFEGKDLRINE